MWKWEGDDEISFLVVKRKYFELECERGISEGFGCFGKVVWSSGESIRFGIKGIKF